MTSVTLWSVTYPAPKLPYAQAWAYYVDAGLRPIPVTDAPPSGYHRWTPAQAERWAHENPYAQTALTIGDGFVMLDDDDAEQVAALEAELGARPYTLYSTSRGAGAARRKSLYRVPADSVFRGEYSGGEVIDARHRFAFVCPTVNRRTGEVEEWYAGDDTPLERFPTAVDMRSLVRDLPAAWVEYLSRDARLSAPERPYDGPTTFEGGELSPRVLEVAQRHPDTSHYPDMNAALMSLAWVAARFPEAEGIETLLEQITAAYVLRPDTRTPETVRQARVDRAWQSALATQAATHAEEWEALEDEFGAECVLWWQSHTPSTPPPATSTEAERLEALTPEEAVAEFGWDWQNQLAQAQMRAEVAAQEAAQAVPSSWAPRDLSDVMAEGYEPPMPTVFRRSDGMGLFYPGTVNEFHAVGGTGKTLVALAVCCEALQDGHTVLYIDYEEAPGRIVQRLRSYGIEDEIIRSQFLYVKPTEAPTQEALGALTARAPHVVVIDTFSESFGGLRGGDSNSTDDVTRWFALPRTFADAGACVIVTDHIPKDAQNRTMPIGSQAKHSSYKGAVYYLEAPTGSGLVQGGRGRLRFILGKDNGGALGLRAGECAATFELDATGAVSTWELQAPNTGAALAHAAEAHAAERERIARALTDAGGSVSARGRLWEALGVHKNATPGLVAALTSMIEDGAVVEEPGERNAKRLRLASNLAPPPEADAEADLWKGVQSHPI